jgi:serralysin
MSETENTIAHPQACGCAACTGFDPDSVVVLDGNVDGTGGVIANKPVYTLDQVIANMNRSSYGPTSGIPGPQWNYGEDFMGQNKSGNPLVIQYGFYESRAEMFQVPYVYPNATGTGLLGRSEYGGFQTFSAAQRAATEKAIMLWDDLIAVSFVKTTAPNADITYGNLTNAPTTQAYAYLPYNYGGNSAGLQGDVWVSLSAASNLQLDNGFYGLATLIHETGHALGLQHPGAYNAAPGLSITFPANAEYYQDTRQYSQMSYFNAEFSGAGHIDWNRVNWVYGQTPLLHDIATIQAMYGADLTTRTTDTVYGFNSTAGRDVYDFATNTMPVISIYDAGGVDTLDFSGWNTSSKIDLNPGAFSSGGGSGVVPLDVLKARGILPPTYTEAQYLALRARYNAVDGMLHDNISIAYGTTIENASGGGGDDTIIGNGVDNVLLGNAGNDIIEGRLGNDTINGGLGADSMLGGAGNDYYFVDDSGDLVAELVGEGTDTVSSSISYTLTGHVDNLVLTGAALAGTGNVLDNAMTGNELGNTLSGGFGNDTLTGLGGDDTLDGGAGADAMTGGVGNDSYYVDQSGDSVTEAAGEGTDTVNSSISYTLGANLENLTLTGTAASATGNALSNVITGNASDNVIDGGLGADSMIGGRGDDLYFVDNSGDTVTELAGGGNDTVSTGLASYTLGDNVENLILTGSSTDGTGNDGNNVLTGNGLSNRLNGGAGDDRLIGGDGVDFFTGGAGNDVFVGEINATKVASKNGLISLDVILDFSKGDKLDLSGIDANTAVAGDQAFTLVNSANPKNAGEVSIRHFGNMNAAEAALGMDLDGVDGDSPFGGPVSVVFGNVDGGDADFAIVFVNTPSLTVSDFIM